MLDTTRSRAQNYEFKTLFILQYYNNTTSGNNYVQINDLISQIFEKSVNHVHISNFLIIKIK